MYHVIALKTPEEAELAWFHVAEWDVTWLQVRCYDVSTGSLFVINRKSGSLTLGRRRIAKQSSLIVRVEVNVRDYHADSLRAIYDTKAALFAYTQHLLEPATTP